MGGMGGTGMGAPDGLVSGFGRDGDLPHRPVLVRDVARVALGPEFRRGALADEHGEVVGGVVVMRFGANPRDVIARVREVVMRLNDPAGGLLPEGVRLRPFYDRTSLIAETSETLELALIDELWITLLVVGLFLLHARSSLIVAAVIPIAVLIAFVAMEHFGVDSNIMSLTGIAIAIGTMVDMGIVMCENIYTRLEENRGKRPIGDVVEEAAIEVGPALVTACLTTIVSFLPIFFLTDQEGKLFRPLAWTKTFALSSAALTGVLLVPVLCRLFLAGGGTRGWVRWVWIASGTAACAALGVRVAPDALQPWIRGALGAMLGGFVLWRAAGERLTPIDANPVSRLILGAYQPTLRWVLANKGRFLLAPLSIVLAAVIVTAGGAKLTGALVAVFGPEVARLRPLVWLAETFPGLGQEFMPPLDEGTLLYMPSLLPQASLSQAMEVMQRQNAAFASVPEVARVVGKLGRVESALDPAPVGMLETVVALKSRDQWRPGLLKADLVEELTRLGHTPGVLEGAGAWLQPIETRVIMLNSGIRAPLAVKLIGSPKDMQGTPLDAKAGVLELERVANIVRDVIADVPGVAGPNVENLGGKPYAELVVDREAAAHYGVTVGDVQDVLQTSIGGMVIDQTVEGRERYSIRVAYARELRDRLDALGDVLVRGKGGAPVPLAQLAQWTFQPGPAAIKTEDGRLRLHVTFAARGRDEGAVMEDVLARIESWRAEQRDRGRMDPIPQGVAVEAAGRYEGQMRARARFLQLIPVCLFLIFFLLYLQFKRFGTVLNVFAALPVCIAGGLLLMHFYPGLKDAMYALGLWDLPSAGPVYMTVAVVVGFIALAGIATDDGVVIATYLDQVFERERPTDIAGVRAAVLEAGSRRIRPCLMTTFTTILALYPILASSGRGSDVAQPMALPAVGGMLASLVSLFIVPLVYCWTAERRLRGSGPDPVRDGAAS